MGRSQHNCVAATITANFSLPPKMSAYMHPPSSPQAAMAKQSHMKESLLKNLFITFMLKMCCRSCFNLFVNSAPNQVKQHIEQWFLYTLSIHCSSSGFYMYLTSYSAGFCI